MSDLQDKIAKVAARNERIDKGLELLERQSMQLGAKYERERIIQLLEEHTHPEAEAEYLIECDLCERYHGVGLAVALIKGEQNDKA